METTLPQALLLLVLNDQSGKTVAGYYQPALAGAAISEFLLREIVELSDDVPPLVIPLRHNQKLSAFLAMCDEEIGSASGVHTLDHWIMRLANLGSFVATLADELVHLGALSQEKVRIFGVLERTVWPEASPRFETELKQAMRDAMFSESETVEERIGVLIGLARAAGLLSHNFAAADLAEHEARIDRIANGELLAADATETVVKFVDQAIRTATAMADVTAATIIT